jgi:hypothetical protein
MEHLLTFQADKTRKIIGQHPAHGVKDDTTSSSRNSTYRGSKNWHKDQVFEKFAEASLSGESATGIKIWESSTPVVLKWYRWYRSFWPIWVEFWDRTHNLGVEY